MYNNEVFDKNTKSNFVNNLNTSKSNNEAERLNKNFKFYNARSKNNKNFTSVNSSNNNLINDDNTVSRIKKAQNKTKNNKILNTIATRALEAANIPPGVSENVVNSKVGQKAISNFKKHNPALNLLDKLFGGGKEESEESSVGEGIQNFVVPKKVIKWLIIISPAALTLTVFCCLVIAASQIFFQVGTFDNADSFDPERVGEIFEDLDEIADDFAYSGIVYNENLIYNYRFKESNLIEVTNKKYNNSELEKLEDYYSGFSNYLNGEYDMDAVYMFFFKLYYIKQYYINNYKVKLDIPLLMATLRLQSNDMGEVFSSNIVDYDVNLKDENPMFAHDYDWSGYVTSKKNSGHDIEVLAQHMVVKNGSSYKIDNDAYKEYLKEFLEKKYFLNGYKEPSSDNEPGENISNPKPSTNKCDSCTNFTSKFLNWLIRIANDDSHGYSQHNRDKGQDYDCSSLIYFGLINSGIKTKTLGGSAFSTRNEREKLKKSNFKEISYTSINNLKPGDILWRSGHTEAYVGNGLCVGAHISETGGITGKVGDQTGKEISVTNCSKNWEYVYRYRE